MIQIKDKIIVIKEHITFCIPKVCQKSWNVETISDEYQDYT